MLVESIVPSEFQGVAVKQIGQRSGIILSMETVDEWAVLKSEVSISILYISNVF